MQASGGSGRARRGARRCLRRLRTSIIHTLNVSILVNHVPVFYRVQCFCELCVLLCRVVFNSCCSFGSSLSEDNKVTVSLCCETCEHSSSFLALTHEITCNLSNSP